MNPKFWQARKEKGLSQTALGADAGIGQAEISMIENDGWIPPVAVRQRLATLLEVPVDELFDPLADLSPERHA